MKPAPSRGHYDALQLPPEATAIDIREHFRRLALETHPDEGGSLEAFKAVTAAFDVLSDGRRRAEYDKQRIATGSRDGVGQRAPESQKAAVEEPEASEIRRSAREIISTIVDEPSDVQQKVLQKCTVAELEMASQLLRQSNSKYIDRPKPDSGDGAHETIWAGLNKDTRGAYACEMSWEKLKLRTAKTYSLPEALDWHITLTQLKAAALQRLAADGAKPMKTPLTEEELALGYQASPTMRLVICSIHGWGSARVSSPCTPSLSLAVKHLFKFQTCWKDRKEASSSKRKQAIFEGRLEKIKKEASKEVEQERYRRELAEKSLVVEVTKRLQRHGRGKHWVPGGNAEIQTHESDHIARHRLRQSAPENFLGDIEEEKNVAIEMCKLLKLDLHGSLEVADKVGALGDDHLAAARSLILGQKPSKHKTIKDA